jgi:methyl-accepting chemotaxis protein
VTGRLFFKLLAGVCCILLIAMVTVDYFVSRVAAGIRLQILASTALAFLPAAAIAALLARWISHRFAAIATHANELARGNFRSRLPVTGGAEFGQLARTLNETAATLQKTWGAAAARARRTGEARTRAQGFRHQRVTRTAHTTGIDSGLCGDLARWGAARSAA